MKKEYRFYVYIISNYNRTSFYIGVTNNILERIIQHKSGIGSKFTSKYKTNELLYYETYAHIQDAISREKELKKWRREKKINLIKTENPEFKNLNPKIFKAYEISDNEIKQHAEYIKEKFTKL